MANISVNKKFKTEEPLEPNQIRNFMNDKINEMCNVNIETKNNQKMTVYGNVKESVFTKMCTFTADITVKTTDDAASISVTGQSKPNWVFWVFVVIGLFTGIFMVIAFVLYWMQKDKPNDTLKDVVEATDTEFAVI